MPVTSGEAQECGQAGSNFCKNEDALYAS